MCVRVRVRRECEGCWISKTRQQLVKPLVKHLAHAGDVGLALDHALPGKGARKSVYWTSAFDQCWSIQCWSITVGLALDHALPASRRGVAVEQGLI